MVLQKYKINIILGLVFSIYNTCIKYVDTVDRLLLIFTALQLSNYHIYENKKNAIKK